MPDWIEDLLHDKHQTPRAIVDALTRDDLERVRSAVLERGNPLRVRAMDLLVAARVEDADRLLAGMLRDREEDVALRAAAARQLGRLGGADAERWLVEALLEATQSTLQIAIAAALAKIGSPDSLEGLGRLVDASEGSVRQQADFARSVIAYRHGIHGYELPIPVSRDILEFDRNRAAPFTVSPAPLREAILAFSSLASESFGVSFARELAFRIDCAPEQMLLALDQAAFGGSFADTAAARPLLLGILAHRAPEDGSYSVRWIVFSWPGEDERPLHLAVHRLSGPQVLFGSVDIVKGRVDFEVRAVRMPGAVPVELQGQFERSRIEVSVALSERTRMARRSPTPLEPPAGKPRGVR